MQQLLHGEPPARPARTSPVGARWGRLLAVLALLLTGGGAWGQSSANYAFSTSTTGSLVLDRNSNAVDMSAGTTQLVGADLDNSSGVGLQTLPISFTFMGTAFTQFSASSNGMLRLGPTAVTSTTYTVATGTAASPIISAFGGDLRTGSSGKVHYKVVGTAPNRTLVVEFLNMSLLYVASPGPSNGTYQVRLYEATGAVEFVYGAMFRNSGTTAFNSQQVGIGFAAGSTAGKLAYILSATNANTNNSATFAQQTYTVNTAIANLNSTADGSRRTYTYVPTPPATPTTLTFTSVTSTGMTVGFTDNSTTENSFLVQYSTDNVTFTTPTGGTIASTNTAGTGTTYSLALTGLTPATTYYIRVVAIAEVASSALTGSQATATGTPRTVNTLTYTQNGANTYRSQTNQQVTGLNVNTAGNSGSALTLNSVTFDLGTTNAADITNARLYSTGTSATFATTTLVATTGTIASNYTLTVTTPASLPTGDNYFWLTYDITSTATPGNTVASVPTAVNVSGTSYTSTTTPAIVLSGAAASRLIVGPLNGPYTVGVGGNYTTLTAAIADLNLRGVDNTTAGATGVTFSLINQAATTVYNAANGETFPLTVSVVAGADATHRVTIKPASGVTASISGSSGATTALLVLNGTDYLTLDGSNAVGGTTRDLTLANTATTTNTAAIWVKSLGTAAGATYDQLLNLNLAAGSNTVTTYGIFAGGATIGSTGADNDFLTIQNNAITACNTGIIAAGTTTGTLDGLTIAGNLVGPATPATATNLTYAGIRLQNVAAGGSVTGNTVRNIVTSTDRELDGIQVQTTTGLTLSNNTISNVTLNNAAGTNNVYGLSLAATVQNTVANANTISNISTTSTDATYYPFCAGILISTGTANCNVTVSNTFISGLACPNGPIGIFINGSTAQSGIKLYYNSINLAGAYTSASGALSANVYVLSGATGLDIRNNILANTLTGSNSTSLGYLLISLASSSAYTFIDYNDYYVSGSQNVLAYFNSSDQTTLAALRTATGQDANSLSVAPPFVSATNLHLDNTQPTASSFDGKAANNTGVATDYDGDIRNATMPDVGADEFLLPSQDVGITALLQPAASNCYSGAQPVQVTIMNFGSSATTQAIPVAVTITFPNATTQTLTATYSGAAIAAGGTVNFTVGNYTVNGSGSYSFDAKTTYNPDSNTGNDALITQTVAVTVPDAITITPSTCGTTVYANTPVTLTASSPTGYTYTWASTTGGGLATTTGAAVTATPTQTATYTVTGTSGACSITQSITLQVIGVTVPTQAQCAGSSFTVTAAVPVPTYSGTAAPNAAIPDNSTTGVSSAIAISGAPAGSVISSSSTVKVTLNIAHTYDADLQVYLVGPGNAGTLELTTGNGGSGINYTNTVLSTAGTTSVTSGSAPFTGTYAPEGTTGTAPATNSYSIPAAALNGTTLNGTWTLWVFDNASGDIGTLANWALEVGNSTTTTTLSGPAGATITGPTGSGGTATFTVNNAPTGNNTYTLTTTDNTTSCAASTSFVVTTTETTVWTGAVSNAWLTSGNWSACVPSATISARIPAGLSRYPTVSAASVTKDLLIEAGATLTHTGATLQVWGDLTNSGTANLTGGTIAFRAAGPQLVTGISTFTNLTLNQGTVSTVTMMNSMTVTGNVTMTNGVLNTNGNVLTLGAGGALVNENDTDYILGQVAVTRTLAAGTAQTFGGIGLTLTPPTGSTAPGLTPVVRTTGVVLTGIGTSQSIQRYYDIQPAVNTGLNVTMDFTYFDHERNGIAAASVQLFRSTTGTTGPWERQFNTTVSGNTVTKTGITDFSVWTLGDAANPLPVTLTKFEAVRQGRDAALSWATTSEVNNRGFEVQVSTDGTAFHQLGFVAGAGNSQVARSYAFLDQESGKAGLRYYRLRQLDLTGAASFSPVRTVQFEAAAGLVLQAVPNPFNGSLAVSLTLPAASPAIVVMTDALGRVVRTQDLGLLPAGLSQPSLTGIDGLATGVYVLRVSVAGGVHTLKVVKE